MDVVMVPSELVVEIPILVKCALTNTGCGTWDCNLTDLLRCGSLCDPIPSLEGCLLVLCLLLALSLLWRSVPYDEPGGVEDGGSVCSVACSG